MIDIQLSVVIGCYNQLDALKKVLPQFAKQTRSKSDFEVILVDSTSTDGSLDFYQSYKAEFNLIIHVQKNMGKVGARNKGVELARGGIILITDADMIPHENLIESHIKAHEESKKLCCFQGLAYNLDRLEWPLKKAQLSPQVGSDPKHMSALGWYYFLTGNLSMPKLLFEQEHGFNYAFQGYGWEDLELGYRLSKRKIPLYYLKSAINYHYHVITKDEEIQRNIKKGESARTMYNLHPELKWFLGANPVSLFMFPRISIKSSFYKRMKIWYEKNPETSIKHKFGFWFLKEYNYIQGFVKA